MSFEVTAKLQYEVNSPSTIILNIQALKNKQQIVLNEQFSTQPNVNYIELASPQHENRFIKLDIPKSGKIDIFYTAEVKNAWQINEYTITTELPMNKLNPEILASLLPSRYCQSDRLYRLAHNQFGHIENTFSKVTAITEWIYKNVQYLSGSTNAQTSAFDTVTEQAGVCRDFAHLGIALCRALTIPARYFTGYAYKLSPPDFHACFEAYINERWVLFDATKLVPLNGLVKIATGKDAADTFVASIFGEVQFISSQVTCSNPTHDFEHYYHDPTAFKGVTYF